MTEASKGLIEAPKAKEHFLAKVISLRILYEKWKCLQVWKYALESDVIDSFGRRMHGFQFIDIEVKM